MSVRYIGSKARIAEEIMDLVGLPTGGRFVDAFSGTGSVAAAASRRGWPVTVNDSLASSVAMSTAAVIGSKNVPFDRLGGYQQALSSPQDAKPVEGFIYQEYSPASRLRAPVERRYFTLENAALIDGMRAKIREWSRSGLLSCEEENLLLSDLMRAANGVANIAGTYGCFLRDWTEGARRRLTLRARVLPPTHVDFKSSHGDVFELITRVEDVVYYDPPYTKRQYSAYYHILETIYAGDRPPVGGVTGLRPWRENASIFCYKQKALNALTQLIVKTKADRVFLSYSTEGHVQQGELMDALSDEGHVSVHSVAEIGRYRPNARASEAGGSVEEYLIEFQSAKRRIGTPRENAPA